MPAAERSPEASMAAGCAGSRRPSPHSTSVPTMTLTMWCRKPSAAISTLTSRLEPVDAKAADVADGRLSGAGTEKARKSCSPSRQAPAAAITSTSIGRGTCQAKRAVRAMARRVVENGINVDSLAGRKARREIFVDRGCVAYAADREAAAR